MISRCFQLLLLVFTFSAGCGGGGEVHFIPDREMAPNRVETPDVKRRSETFLYRVPTGRPMIVFVYHPRKSMRNLREPMRRGVEFFLESFWANYARHSARVSEVGFILAKEMGVWRGKMPSLFLTPDQTEYSEMRKGSMAFFQEAISSASMELEPFEIMSGSPLGGLAWIATDLSKFQGKETADRLWIHFVYLRDSDLRSEATDQVLEMERKSFIERMDWPPLSRFRYSIHTLTFMNEGSVCRPQTWQLSTRVLASMAGTIRWDYDLCRLLVEDPLATSSLMDDIASAVLADHGRVVLQDVPEFETLAFKVNGKPIERHLISHDTNRNEVLFTRDLAETMKVGDTIEVEYEY